MIWNILGNPWAADLLTRHIANGSVRHAYLFCGPPGVGRRTLALHFVQALNCQQPPAPGVPCGTCRTCQQIERLQLPDLALIQIAEDAQSIKVEQVRELQRILALAPYQAPYRVALLLGFERATPSAQNALLKTLEEPAEKAILLLTADSPDNLLPTITSRCEVLRLRPMVVEDLADALRARPSFPAESAAEYAHIAGGRPGLAIKLAQDEEARKERTFWLDQLSKALTGGIVERFTLADRVARDKNRLRTGLRIWLTFWRDLMLLTSAADAPLTNLDAVDRLTPVASQTDFAAARRCAAALEDALECLDENVNPRLLVEVALLDWPRFTLADSPATPPAE